MRSCISRNNSFAYAKSPNKTDAYHMGWSNAACLITENFYARAGMNSPITGVIVMLTGDFPR